MKHTFQGVLLVDMIKNVISSQTDEAVMSLL